MNPILPTHQGRSGSRARAGPAALQNLPPLEPITEAQQTPPTPRRDRSMSDAYQTRGSPLVPIKETRARKLSKVVEATTASGPKNADQPPNPCEDQESLTARRGLLPETLNSQLIVFLPAALLLVFALIPLRLDVDGSPETGNQNATLFVFAFHTVYFLVAATFGVVLFSLYLPAPPLRINIALVLVAAALGTVFDVASLEVFHTDPQYFRWALPFAVSPGAMVIFGVMYIQARHMQRQLDTAVDRFERHQSRRASPRSSETSSVATRDSDDSDEPAADTSDHAESARLILPDMKRSSATERTTSALTTKNPPGARESPRIAHQTAPGSPGRARALTLPAAPTERPVSMGHEQMRALARGTSFASGINAELVTLGVEEMSRRRSIEQMREVVGAPMRIYWQLVAFACATITTYIFCLVYSFYFISLTHQADQLVASALFPVMLVPFKAMLTFVGKRLDSQHDEIRGLLFKLSREQNHVTNRLYMQYMGFWVGRLFQSLYFRSLYLGLRDFNAFWILLGVEFAGTLVLYWVRTWRWTFLNVEYPLQQWLIRVADSQRGIVSVIINAITDSVDHDSGIPDKENGNLADMETRLLKHRTSTLHRYYYFAMAQRFSAVCTVATALVLRFSYNAIAFSYSYDAMDDARYALIVQFLLIVLVVDWVVTTAFWVAARQFYSLDLFGIGAFSLRDRRYMVAVLLIAVHISQDVLLATNNFRFV